VTTVARGLRSEIKQTKPFASAAEEAFLNLLRTSGQLQQALAAELKPYGLTPTQYNVLRILRGAHPEALPCGEVGARMVTPEPDVTRMLDRLERRELVSRRRDRTDRRVVMATIEAPGLELLSRLDRPVVDWLDQHLGHLGDDRLDTLIELLQLARKAP
jgi:DNA-binding MarR family transcriptional regulator